MTSFSLYQFFDVELHQLVTAFFNCVTIENICQLIKNHYLRRSSLKQVKIHYAKLCDKQENVTVRKWLILFTVSMDLRNNFYID